MIILLSPSKTLDMDSPAAKVKSTQPALLKESEKLISHARKMDIYDIASLMKVSEKLAKLNHERFANFTTPFTDANAKPCGFAFKGDVYDGMDFESFSPQDREFAQTHLRILSGLYGLLRPLDLMQAYRLEMGIKLANERGKNLYEFWGDRITNEINKAAAESKSECVVNLASNEYFSAVKPKALNAPIITPQFKESKNGTYKVIGIMAKKARGRMAAWIIQNRITSPVAIQAYNQDDYRYNAALSSPESYIFTR